MLDGQGQWYRRKIVYFTTAGEKPPLWPHPSAPIQRWIKENVEYTCELRDGGNISVDAFDVVNGKAHWRLSQQDDYLWHPIVMHLAEQWSTWRYAKYSGVVGGYFTLVSDNPSQSELTSPPLNNAIYVESNK